MTDTPASHSAPLTCSEVVERIYEFLDGELTAEVEAQIRSHLAVCKRCYPEFEHERVFLRFLEKRALIEKAPPSLRKRIFQTLMDEETARHDT
ncbi:MAG TPA: mycothiol system anti-sigma-R factor [Gemmatimonadaceae bacterium]|nr:mycothiol system anti-sigma-R factor [Gemmatimonadaceae bacterium]